MLLREMLGRYLDKVVQPEIYVIQRPRSAFQVCGYTGLALAILLAMTPVIHLGLSSWVMAGLVLSAMGTFLALAMITKIITGEESIVYYHHEIAVMVMAAALLRLLHQPILLYLDVTILGIGTFLVCGRVGCLMVGCCYGRPHRWGVRYRPEHAAAGFTPHLVGVRLFPVQLLESLWVCGIVLLGIFLVMRGSQPGGALVWYTVAYGLGRFIFEFCRGDPGRTYLGGFSEAQWTSLLLMTAAVLAELLGLLPFRSWHLAATVGLVVIMAALAATDNPDRRIFHPRHVGEVADLLSAAHARAAESSELHIGQTSLGIQISASTVQDGTKYLDVFAFSRRDEPLSDETARKLARLALQLRHCGDGGELLRGQDSVYHLLIPVVRSAHAL